MHKHVIVIKGKSKWPLLVLSILAQFFICPSQIGTEMQETNWVVNFAPQLYIKVRVVIINNGIAVKKIRNYHQESCSCNFVC